MTTIPTPSHGYQATPRVSPGGPRATGDVTATPTTGPFREAGQVEQLTNAVLNMVAEQSAANMAARAGFNDPALHRLWLALGQLRGKGGLQLNESSLPFGDLADGKGHVGEALPDLVMNGVGCRRLDLTGIDPCHVGLCDRVEVGHEPSPSSVVSTPEGKGSVGSASDDPAETDDLELLRAQLVDAMSSESERRWCAGWAKDLERTLHREGGIWETLGRVCGWPLGYRGEDGWVTWREAGILYDDDTEKKVDPTPTPTDLSSADPIFTSYAHPTLTDHLEDLIRVDEILTREFPRTPSRERIRVAIEITAALKWGAL